MGDFSSAETAWMETNSGRQFNYAHLDAGSICIEDVAAALSKMCRYNGHTRRFYSVAEHCVLMSRWVSGQADRTIDDCKVALLHDASEAYLSDVVRPVKNFLEDYKAMEASIDGFVMAHFEVQYPFPPWLKEIDTRILVDERAQAMNPSTNVWGVDGLEPLGVNVQFWSPDQAEQEFLREYRYVTAH
jgi:hypothetical protein